MFNEISCFQWIKVWLRITCILNLLQMMLCWKKEASFYFNSCDASVCFQDFLLCKEHDKGIEVGDSLRQFLNTFPCLESWCSIITTYKISWASNEQRGMFFRASNSSLIFSALSLAVENNKVGKRWFLTYKWKGLVYLWT